MIDPIEMKTFQRIEIDRKCNRTIHACEIWSQDPLLNKNYLHEGVHQGKDCPFITKQKNTFDFHYEILEPWMPEIPIEDTPST